jgi:hypothetical protein
VPVIIQSGVTVQIEEARQLLNNTRNLANDIANNTRNIGKLVADIDATLRAFIEMTDELILAIAAVVKCARENSSLMNTEGLRDNFNRLLLQTLQSVPGIKLPEVDGAIDAQGLDTALFSELGKAIASPRRLPELFITASNISANRATVLSVASDDTNKRIADRNSWIFDLRGKGVSLDFSGIKKKSVSAPANPYVFTATGYEVTPTLDTVHLSDPNGETGRRNIARADIDSEKALAAMATAGRGGPDNPAPTRSQPAQPVPSGPSSGKQPSAIPPANGKRIGGMATAASNMGAGQMANTALRHYDITGQSLLVGAVLTSAAIPAAFPPKRWSFSSQGENYSHWMVDGGVVDNRPIDIAVKAGATFIVSFELTPLLSHSTELARIVVKRPKLDEVITDSFIDTAMNASFYRYFEDLVYNNDPKNGQTTKPVPIYRMAPMMYAEHPGGSPGNGVSIPEEHSIGVYDFNGKRDKNGALLMGLFDWFMKGYLDAFGSQANYNDPVCTAYKALPAGFGAKKNANKGRRSGFYDATLKAHPDAPPIWWNAPL